LEKLANKPDYAAIMRAKKLPNMKLPKLKIKSKYRYDNMKKHKYLGAFELEVYKK